MNARPLLLLSLLVLSISGRGLAQCPNDDAFEPNDNAASAVLLASGTTSGLILSELSKDYWLFDLPSGKRLTITSDFVEPTFITEPILSDANVGGTAILVFNTLSNLSGTDTRALVRMVASVEPGTSGTCSAYSITASLSDIPCFGAVEDPFEENDSCENAVPIEGGFLGGLLVSRTDPDFFRISVPPNSFLNLELETVGLLPDGLIRVELLDSETCGSLDIASSFSPPTTVTTPNGPAGNRDIVVNVSWLAGPSLFPSCANYELTWSFAPDPCGSYGSDYFEDTDHVGNDSMEAAATLAPGVYQGLVANIAQVDQDWYAISVNPGATLEVTSFFNHFLGDIDLYLYEQDGSFANGSVGSVSSSEQFTHTNLTGALHRYLLFVALKDDPDAPSCTTYSLTVGMTGGGPPILLPYCFGNGDFTPCPCGNESPSQYPGGCSHQDGLGAFLTAKGIPSLSDDTLQFDLQRATANTFGFLYSGDNALPAIGSCIGCGIQSFDGMRCAGGNALRHGARATDENGRAPVGWGAPNPPLAGFAAASGFSAGQTRYFSLFFRTLQTETCGTGYNSTNGVRVTFLP